jgi:4'-phosphopantetheinyl transferase
LTGSEAPTVPWQDGSSFPTLGESQVHVWRADLERERDGPVGSERLLDPKELERASRFRFPRDRRRFAARRAVLRVLVGGYLGRPPERVAFQYSPLGKPFVAEAGGSALQFSASHSEGVALLAFAWRRRLGVDIEKIRADDPTDELASRFFSPDETSRLRALATPQRREAFFACWTRKEAYLKARGDGLSLPLASFSVSLGPDEPPALLRPPPGDDAARWTLEDLALDGGFTAALAVEGPRLSIARYAFGPVAALR